MKLILFDIDGTLIRSHGVGRRAFAAAIEEVLGRPDALAGVSLGGMTDHLILETVLDRNSSDYQTMSDLIFETYQRHLKAGLAVADKFEVLPGVRQLLKRLFGVSALVLGTGNIEAGARLKLGRAGLNDFFPTGGFGNDARDRADLLRAGVRKAHIVFDREHFDEVWVVGDTPRDVEAAQAIGAKCLAVSTGTYSQAELRSAGPEVLMHNLSATESALETLLT